MVDLNSHADCSQRPRPPRYSAIASLLCLAAIAMCVGCGGVDGNGRNRVSGTVTLDGQPIPNGMISFEPDFNKGNTGPQGIAPIHEGRFDTNSPGGRGIIGGPHRVRIEGYRGEAPDPQLADPSVPGNIQILIKNYETEIDLPAGETTHDFAIISEEL
ncbi:MAG: hypothetical protein WDZ51_18525 [Pirellulaceae bacterium]